MKPLTLGVIIGALSMLYLGDRTDPACASVPCDCRVEKRRADVTGYRLMMCEADLNVEVRRRCPPPDLCMTMATVGACLRFHPRALTLMTTDQR